MSETAVVGETCPRCLWSFVPRCKCGGRIVGEIPKDEDNPDDEDDEDREEDEKAEPGPVCVSCRASYGKSKKIVTRCGCGIKRCEDVLKATAEWEERRKAPDYDPRRPVNQERWAPRPPCCDKARLTRGHQESMGWDFPFVYLSLDGKGWRVGGHPAMCCPFCTSRFPEVEIDPNATGRFAEGDDCGHCMSCGRRYCGLCKPPSARFRIKVS